MVFNFSRVLISLFHIYSPQATQNSKLIFRRLCQIGRVIYDVYPFYYTSTPVHDSKLFCSVQCQRNKKAINQDKKEDEHQESIPIPTHTHTCTNPIQKVHVLNEKTINFLMTLTIPPTYSYIFENL
jgi:hypothetical protein